MFNELSFQYSMSPEAPQVSQITHENNTSNLEKRSEAAAHNTIFGNRASIEKPLNNRKFSFIFKLESAITQLFRKIYSDFGYQAKPVGHEDKELQDEQAKPVDHEDEKLEIKKLMDQLDALKPKFKLKSAITQLFRKIYSDFGYQAKPVGHEDKELQDEQAKPVGHEDKELEIKNLMDQLDALRPEIPKDIRKIWNSLAWSVKDPKNSLKYADENPKMIEDVTKAIELTKKLNDLGAWVDWEND